MDLQLTPIDWNAVAALSTIAIAVFGYLINRNILREARKRERFSALVEYRQEIIDFSSRYFAQSAIALSECDKPEGERDRALLRQTSANLSVILDEGRFIFPNFRDGSGHGDEKGPAFAGYRRGALDAIHAAYYAVESMISETEAARLRRLSYQELLRAGKPFRADFKPTETRALNIAARRSYLNAVVPSTFPHEWRQQFFQLYGSKTVIPDAVVEAKLAQMTQGQGG